MSDLMLVLWCTFLGFFIGGIVGMALLAGVFPAAWIGALIGLIVSAVGIWLPDIMDF